MPSTHERDVRGRADGAAPNAQPFSRELCQNCASVVPGARGRLRMQDVRFPAEACWRLLDLRRSFVPGAMFWFICFA
ncbi:hypothetical protein HN51_016443 [Arachis hypogaea]